MWLGEFSQRQVPTISSGSLALDIALGIGGIPRGRTVEVFGPESSGKTTLALHFIAEAQQAGGTAGFIDAEHALDPTYAQAIGIDLDDLLLSQPNSGEQALEITEQLVRSGTLDMVVIDSVAALVPEAEMTGSMGDEQVGRQARLMSQAMRKLTSAVGESNTTVVFINQLRSNVNAGASWGPSTTTSGGRALKFFASVRLDIRRIGSIEDQHGTRIGNETKIQVVKNKLASPFRMAYTDILYGHGIVRSRELIRIGHSMGLIARVNGRYVYRDAGLGQDLSEAASFLKEQPELAHQVEQAIQIQSGLLTEQLLEEPTDPDQATDPVDNSDASTEPREMMLDLWSVGK